jgi:hypothetical protein
MAAPQEFPQLMIGIPILCDFRSDGNNVAKSPANVVARFGRLPPGVMLMRLFEYENSASLIRFEPIIDVTFATIDLEGCDQLLSSCGN